MFLRLNRFCRWIAHAKTVDRIILRFVGLYSYEIYISNYSVAETLLYLFRLGYMRHLWEIVFSYIVLSFIYGFIWIMISRIINNRLINRKK